MGSEWYIRQGDSQSGPFSESQIRKRLPEIQRRANTFVRQGHSDWFPVAEVAERFDLLVRRGLYLKNGNSVQGPFTPERISQMESEGRLLAGMLLRQGTRGRWRKLESKESSSVAIAELEAKQQNSGQQLSFGRDPSDITGRPNRWPAYVAAFSAASLMLFLYLSVISSKKLSSRPVSLRERVVDDAGRESDGSARERGENTVENPQTAVTLKRDKGKLVDNPNSAEDNENQAPERIITPTLQRLEPFEIPAWFPIPETEASLKSDFGQSFSPGEYVGVYFKSRQFHKLFLRLEAEGSQKVSGIARVFTYSEQRLGTRASPGFRLVGVYELKGDFDPDTMEIGLSFVAPEKNSKSEAAWLERRLVGVATSQPAAIAGEILYPPSGRAKGQRFARTTRRAFSEGFVLMQDSGESRQVVIDVLDAMVRQRRNTFGRNSTNRRQLPNSFLSSFNEWADQFELLYPNVDLQHTDVDKLAPMIGNLFADERFVPFFKRPFDRLTAEQAESVSDLVRSNYQASSNAKGKDRNFISGFFSSTSSINRTRTLSLLWKGRVLRRWKAEQEDRLRGFNSPITVEKNSIALKQAASRQLRTLASVDRSIRLGRRGKVDYRGTGEMASPSVLLEMASLLSNDRNTTLSLSELLSKLMDLDSSIAGFKQNEIHSPQMAKDSRRLALEKLRSIVTTQCQLHIDAAGENRGGLRSFNDLNERSRQLQTIQTKLKGIEIEGLSESIAYLKAKRNELITTESDQICLEIAGIEKIPDLEALSDQLLTSGALKSTTRSKLTKALLSRKRALQVQAIRHLFSVREIDLMDPNGKIIVPPNPAPPTDEEVRLAYLRSQSPLKGRMATPHTYEFTTSVISPLTGFEPVPHWILLRVEDARVNSVQKLSDASSPVYEVEYQLRISSELFSPLDSDDSLGKALSVFSDLQEVTWSDPQSEQFALAKDGWVSPSIIKRLSSSSPVVLGQAINRFFPDRNSHFKDLLDRYPDGIPNLIRMSEIRRGRKLR